MLATKRNSSLMATSPSTELHACLILDVDRTRIGSMAHRHRKRLQRSPGKREQSSSQLYYAQPRSTWQQHPICHPVSSAFNTRGTKCLQETQRSNVNVRWQNFPEKLGPFKEHIGDVEDLKDPDPVIITKMKVLHYASSFCVSDIASIEIRKYVKEADDGQHLLVELQTLVS